MLQWSVEPFSDISVAILCHSFFNDVLHHMGVRVHFGEVPVLLELR
jgi:hypothetical protein